MTPEDGRIPLILLTGFLGSGKTTLLKSLLASQDMRDTAVLFNEFGEISLDHLIVGTVEGETVVLRNGCICCALRDDLRQALADLLDRAASGAIPSFRRVVVETTGLADPVPILQTLLTDPMLRHQFRHERTVTTIDAILGADQLGRHVESVRQAVIADRLVITKADIAGAAKVAAVRAAAVRINPGARVSVSGAPGFDPLSLVAAAESDPERRLRETMDWLDAFEARRATAPRHHHHDDDHHHHQGREHGLAMRSLSLRLTERLDWTAFGVWLTALLHRHGDRILRVKGILDLGDVDGPVILQGVQHIIHPPVHLRAWPDGDRASRIVFIAEDLDPDLIRRSLDTFLAAARAGASRRPDPVAEPARSPMPAGAAG